MQEVGFNLVSVVPSLKERDNTVPINPSKISWMDKGVVQGYVDGWVNECKCR